MEVLVKGTNRRIKLTKGNFVASGGEGSIYRVGGYSYKIYSSSKTVIPFSKIQELSVIKNDNVIKPQRLLLNSRLKPIGYTMKYVANTYALCQIFPKVFRDRVGLDNDTVLKLIRKMQSTIQDIHKVGILLVDINEMNFLTDKKFTDVYFIDVDSYQTPNFPATAIMESIRDRHASKFSILTDWFSFGVVSFEMFIGIHPFKGKHPSIRTMDERMIANIPVFHKDVRYPNVCQPFDIIPTAYKNWYKAVFFEGKRVEPPVDVVEVIIIPQIVKTITGDQDFDIIKLLECESKIIRFVSVGGVRTVATVDEIYINNKKVLDTNIRQIAITPQLGKVVGGSIDTSQGVNNGRLKLHDVVANKEIPCEIAAEEIMSYAGRIFIKNQDLLSEIQFLELPNQLHASAKPVANVMQNATKLFEGLAIQNVLGSFMVSVFPEPGQHYQIQIKEFQGYKLVDAKYDNRVLVVIGNKKGQYDRFIFKFDDKFSSYSIIKKEDITYSGINFVVLDNGVAVHIDENDVVEIFSNDKDADKIRVITSSVITGDMKLFKDGTSVLFSKGDKLYRLKMKGR